MLRLAITIHRRGQITLHSKYMLGTLERLYRRRSKIATSDGFVMRSLYGHTQGYISKTLFRP